MDRLVRLFLLGPLLGLLTILGTGCGDEATATQILMTTPTLTLLPTAVPTPTPLPTAVPTPTPLPTATLTPTPLLPTATLTPTPYYLPQRSHRRRYYLPQRSHRRHYRPQRPNLPLYRPPRPRRHQKSNPADQCLGQTCSGPGSMTPRVSNSLAEKAGILPLLVINPFSLPQRLPMGRYTSEVGAILALSTLSTSRLARGNGDSEQETRCFLPQPLPME